MTFAIFARFSLKSILWWNFPGKLFIFFKLIFFWGIFFIFLFFIFHTIFSTAGPSCQYHDGSKSALTFVLDKTFQICNLRQMLLICKRGLIWPPQISPCVDSFFHCYIFFIHIMWQKFSKYFPSSLCIFSSLFFPFLADPPIVLLSSYYLSKLFSLWTRTILRLTCFLPFELKGYTYT